MEIRINWKPQEKQRQFLTAKEFEVLYVGGRRAGKTEAAVWKHYLLSRDFPGNVGLFTRKHYTDLMDTIIVTWRKVIPPELYSINENKHIITVFTGTKHNSVIYYRGLDASPEKIHKNRGFETGHQLWDQVEECNQSDIEEAIACMSLKLPDGRIPPYRISYLANPQRHYIINRFTQQLDPAYMRLIQTSIFDNKDNLPPEVIANIERLYKVNQKLYDAMVLGSLVISDDPDNIIPYDKAQMCSKTAENITFIDKRIVSIDVARSNEDSTVIYGWGGSQIVSSKIYVSQDLDVTANRAVAMLKEIRANTIIWDADGLGGGLMSHLKHIVPQNTKLIEFHGNNQDVDPLYFNARTEAYFEAAELIKDVMIAIPKDDVLIGQLSTPRSFIQSGKLRVEDKDDIKKRLGGKSPDRADALVYGIWGLKRAPSTSVRQIIRPNTYAEYIYNSEQRKLTTEDLDDIIGNDSVRHWH